MEGEEEGRLLIDFIGSVTSFVGNGKGETRDGKGFDVSFKYPLGIAIDQRNGFIYVSESDGHVIRKITQNGFATLLPTLFYALLFSTLLRSLFRSILRSILRSLFNSFTLLQFSSFSLRWV
jgi:hypothetical protein